MTLLPIALRKQKPSRECPCILAPLLRGCLPSVTVSELLPCWSPRSARSPPVPTVCCNLLFLLTPGQLSRKCHPTPVIIKFSLVTESFLSAHRLSLTVPILKTKQNEIKQMNKKVCLDSTFLSGYHLIFLPSFRANLLEKNVCTHGLLF